MDGAEAMFKDDLVVRLVKNASWLQKLRAFFRPVELGTFHPIDLTGPEQFYLFECERCRKYSADYVHGMHRLYCHSCN